MSLSRRGLLAAGSAVGALAATTAGTGTAAAGPVPGKGQGAGRNRLLTGFDRLAAEIGRASCRERVL